MHQQTNQDIPAIGNVMLTTWTNPTQRTVTLRLFRHGKIVRNRQVIDTGTDVVEIPPGGSVQLPAFLDSAIQEKRHGVIVGGLAPQLVKNGEETPVHPSLDPTETAKRDAEKAAAQALQAKRSADAALMVAEGTIAAAETVAAAERKAAKKAKAEQS